MSIRVPFFHYSILESLDDILTAGRLLSRDSLANQGMDFQDISIDHTQRIRQALGLTNYVPMFAGFYTLYREYSFNGYLMNNYDDPKITNVSFYGSLNRTLQQSLGDNYQNVIIFMIDAEHIYRNADEGRIRAFSDIAIKADSYELEPITNRDNLLEQLNAYITGQNTKVEIDLLDDGETSIDCLANIEAVIVDNEEIEQQVHATMQKCRKRCQVFVNPLPRGPVE